MNKEEIAWVAGLLEGEGSFLFTKSNCLKVQCAMTDLDVLEKLQEYAGGRMASASRSEDHWKPSWVWWISGEQAGELMRLVQPYMLSRRSAKIDEVLEQRRVFEEAKNKRILDRQTRARAAAKEYLNGEKSYRKLQDEYGISFVTVKNYVDKLKQEYSPIA